MPNLYFRAFFGLGLSLLLSSPGFSNPLPPSPRITFCTEALRSTSDISFSGSRTQKREEFKSKYLRISVTTPEENRAWDRMTRALSLHPQVPTTAIEIDFSMLKMVNDTYGFDEGTSVAHFGLREFKERILEFYRSQENTQVFVYSDWKTLRVLIVGKTPESSAKSLQPALTQAMYQVDQNLKYHGVFGFNETSPDWFKVGVGRSLAQSGISSRWSRRFQNSHSPFFFSDNQVQQDLVEHFDKLQKRFANLKSIFANTRRVIAPDGNSLDFEAYEILRKGNRSEQAKVLFEYTYGLQPLSQEIWRDLNEYYSDLDVFVLSPVVLDRKEISLADAVHGGFAIDMIAAGTENPFAVAKAVHSAQNFLEAVNNAYLAVEAVTHLFDRRRKEISAIIYDVLGSSAVMLDWSGDDGIAVFNYPLPLRAKRALVTALANRFHGSRVRIAFVNEKLRRTQDRGELASVGQGIVKSLESALKLEIEPRKAKGLLMAVDMDSEVDDAHALRNVTPKLILGSDENLEWKTDEIETIEREFDRIVSRLYSSSVSTHLRSE